MRLFINETRHFISPPYGRGYEIFLHRQKNPRRIIAAAHAHTKGEVIKMTPKEILYVEDALGHSQFLMQQSQTAATNLQDATLKQQAQQLVNRNQQIFKQFYSLV